MSRGDWVLLALVAGLLLLSLPAAGKATPYPIQLYDAVVSGTGGGVDLQGGTSSLSFIPSSGGMQVWVQRSQCANEDPSTCLPPSTDTRRVTFQPGSIVTIESREGARFNVGLTATDGSIGFQVLNGKVDQPSEGEVEVADVPAAPPDYQRIRNVEGVHLSAPSATFDADGQLVLIVGNGLLRYTDSSGRSGDLETGESWVPSGVQTVHEIALVKISTDATLIGAWNGPLNAYLPTPFGLAGDIGIGGTRFSDVAYRVLEADSAGLVVVPAAEAPETPPAEEDHLPTGTIVAGVSAFGVAMAGLAAYYWPRFSWAFTVLALPMYSRIEKSELLDHNVRENLYELIQHQPGIHAHALAERAGIGWGTTVYHLRLLERNRMVTSQRAGRYRRFFPAAGFLARKREVLSVLQNDTTNNIARLILRKPGMNQKAICEALTISPSLANWHLNRLLESELCQRERRGRTVHYFPGQAWDEIGRDVAG